MLKRGKRSHTSVWIGFVVVNVLDVVVVSVVIVAVLVARDN